MNRGTGLHTGIEDVWRHRSYPDSKVHGANMGPIWGRQDPGGPMLAPRILLSGYLTIEAETRWSSFLAYDIIKCIFVNENIWISSKMSLNKKSIDNEPALIQTMAWRRTDAITISVEWTLIQCLRVCWGKIVHVRHLTLLSVICYDIYCWHIPTLKWSRICKYILRGFKHLHSLYTHCIRKSWFLWGLVIRNVFWMRRL